ncbi:MOS1T transposase, partial [Pseudoatta argentina]
QSNFLLVLKMSIFVPNKVYVRGILLHYFIQKKSAAEAHRILVQTYGDNALSDTTCRDWFRRFKNNDFQLEDKERSGAPKKFQGKELEQLLDEDPSQTLSEIGKILQVDESTVSNRLKGLGMIQKQGHWVPYELCRSPRRNNEEWRESKSLSSSPIRISRSVKDSCRSMKSLAAARSWLHITRLSPPDFPCEKKTEKLSLEGILDDLLAGISLHFAKPAS